MFYRKGSIQSDRAAVALLSVTARETETGDREGNGGRAGEDGHTHGGS